MGVAHQRIAEILDKVGKRDEATKEHERALTIFQKLVTPSPQDDWAKWNAAISEDKLGNFWLTTDAKKAAAPYRDSTALCEQLATAIGAFPPLAEQIVAISQIERRQQSPFRRIISSSGANTDTNSAEQCPNVGSVGQATVLEPIEDRSQGGTRRRLNEPVVSRSQIVRSKQTAYHQVITVPRDRAGLRSVFIQFRFSES